MTTEELIGILLDQIEHNMVNPNPQAQKCATHALGNIIKFYPKETRDYLQDRVNGIIEYADTEEAGKKQARAYLKDMLKHYPRWIKEIAV